MAAHRVFGMVSWRLGRYDEAETHQKLALEIAEREGTPLEQGQLLVDLGNTMFPLKSSRLDMTLELYARAAALFGPGGDYGAQARVMMNRSVTEYTAGRVDEAFTDLRTAIAVAERAHSPFWIGYCHFNLAQYEVEAGRVGEAREALERAVTVMHPLGDRFATQQIAMTEGMIAEAEREFDLAEAHYQKALALAREMAIPAELAEMLYRLVALSHNRGDDATARERLAIALEAGLRKHRPDLAARVDALERSITTSS